LPDPVDAGCSGEGSAPLTSRQRSSIGIVLLFLIILGDIITGAISSSAPPSSPPNTTLTYVTTFSSTNCFFNATIGTIDNTADWQVCGVSVTIPSTPASTRAWLIPTSNGFDYLAGNLQGALSVTFDSWISTNVSSTNLQRTVKYPTDEFAAIIGKTHFDMGYPVSTVGQLTFWTSSKPPGVINFKLFVRVEGNGIPSPTVTVQNAYMNIAVITQIASTFT